MENIVARLYHDTLDLQAVDYQQNPAYRDAAERWNILYDRLVKEMGRDFAEEFGDAQAAMDDWCCISWFEKGLRLGAQLTRELLMPL